MTRKFGISTYVLAAIFLAAPLGAAADWKWTPWKTALSFSNARLAAYNHAAQDCANQGLSHNGSLTYQDTEGMNWDLGVWEYNSRHWYNCIQSQGWSFECRECGFGEDCIQSIAAGNAMDNAQARCEGYGLDFDFRPAWTQLGGPPTRACARESHETGLPGGGEMGRFDQIWVGGYCN